MHKEHIEFTNGNRSTHVSLTKAASLRLGEISQGDAGARHNLVKDAVEHRMRVGGGSGNEIELDAHDFK